MTWRLASGLAVLAVAIVVVGPLGGPLVAWEVVVAAAVLTVAWRWRIRPAGVPPLWREATLIATTPHALGSLELEVAGASDERLGGDRRVRLRLRRLLEHRAGLGRSPTESEAVMLIGDEAWALLKAEDEVMEAADLEKLVTRVEQV